MWPEGSGRNVAPGSAAGSYAVHCTGMPMPATDAVKRKRTQTSGTGTVKQLEHPLHDGRMNRNNLASVRERWWFVGRLPLGIGRGQPPALHIVISVA